MSKELTQEAIKHGAEAFVGMMTASAETFQDAKELIGVTVKPKHYVPASVQAVESMLMTAALHDPNFRRGFALAMVDLASSLKDGMLPGFPWSVDGSMFGAAGIPATSRGTIKDGGAAFVAMLDQLSALDGRTHDASGNALSDDDDSRDLAGALAVIEQHFRNRCFSASQPVRRGFLTAFADFMCIAADGSSVAEGWLRDPAAGHALAFGQASAPKRAN